MGPATSGQTDPNSSLAFLGFSPGENFVKPDLEEWEFALRSKLIAVEVGPSPLSHPTPHLLTPHPSPPHPLPSPHQPSLLTNPHSSPIPPRHLTLHLLTPPQSSPPQSSTPQSSPPHSSPPSPLQLLNPLPSLLTSSPLTPHPRWTCMA